MICYCIVRIVFFFLELPDLLNPVQLSLVQKWQGELRLLQNFKFRRFTQSFLQAKNAVKSSRPASPECDMVTDESEEDEVSHLIEVNPVSYTHLDVYKRQRQYRSVYKNVQVMALVVK